MQHPEIDKSLAVQMQEFLQALLVISDCLNGIRRGRAHQVIPLCGQLRALLTERRRDATPLLLHLARELNQELTFWCMPGVDDKDFPDSLREKLVLHLAGFPLTRHRVFPGQRSVGFSEFLREPIVLFRESKYTMNAVIAEFANKAGGAHYSKRLNPDFAAIAALRLNGESMLANALRQVGEITLEMGAELLKKLVDFEIHFLLAIPEQALPGAVYLYDSAYSGTDMRISLLLTKNFGLEFRAAGLSGARAAVATDRMLDWSSARHVHIGLRMEHDLSTVLEIAFDGVRVGRAVVPGPIFVASEALRYDTYVNRAVDQEPQSLRFWLAEFLMAGIESEPWQRAELVSYFRQQKDDPETGWALYEPGSFAHAASGTTNLTMTGTVRHVTAAEVLPDRKANDH